MQSFIRSGTQSLWFVPGPLFDSNHMSYSGDGCAQARHKSDHKQCIDTRQWYHCQELLSTTNTHHRFQDKLVDWFVPSQASCWCSVGLILAVRWWHQWPPLIVEINTRHRSRVASFFSLSLKITCWCSRHFNYKKYYFDQVRKYIHHTQ